MPSASKRRVRKYWTCKLGRTNRQRPEARLPSEEPGFCFAVFEEYRYDALGRRVLVRARRGCQNDPGYHNGECCIGKLRCIVWDGEHELYEIQMPGQDGSALLENDTAKVALPSDSYDTNKTDPNPYFGRVAYTHGPGVDQPLSLVRLGYGDLIDESNVERPHRSLVNRPGFSGVLVL